MDESLNVFKEERICEYKGNTYSVRDNGAIYRHIPKKGKKRKLDEIWTYGKVNLQSGYLQLSNDRVHQIVATAFLGEAPSKDYIVDHIDTNKQNNRPTNLRWITRLENIVYNPYTKNKLEWICGMPIEDVLKDMSILRNKKLEPQFDWMSSVSQEEANKTLVMMNHRLEENKQRKSYQEYKNMNRGCGREYHPCEPLKENPTIEDYYKNISIGKIFYSRSYDGERNNYKVTNYYFNEDKKEIYVCCYLEGGIKCYYLVTVKKEENKFIYESQSFFDFEGISKYFTLAKGEEWTGGDLIDDYC